jgi:Xaa-Pro aminopeptidase
MKTDHRITELRKLLDESNIDVLIITNLLNIRYLTGFTGSAATLLIGSPSFSKNDYGLLCTDSRYSEQSHVQIAESNAQVEISIGNLATQREKSKLFAKGALEIGIEADSTTIASFNAWTQAMERTIAPSKVKVESLRQFKDEEEIDAIRRASHIADEALADVLPKLKGEPTEIQFAAELEFRMRMLGAEGPSFETIVASGPHSAMPHARPTDRKITEGDPVVIDFGAVWEGYHSDCTRTYFLGDTLSREFQLIYRAVEAAQQAGVGKAVLGTGASAIDSACRDTLAAVNLEEFFTHSTGHGVGLEVHELPWIHKDSQSILAVGDILTVEPGVYLAGQMGVRIEDTIAITKTGSECLTEIPKSPIIS